jgi:hypothetical protein
VVLRAERGPDGLRHLAARIDDDGDVVIAGQDLGPGVEKVFGDGMTEYEWSWRVKAADVGTLVAALGGEPGADVLERLHARCSGPRASELFVLLVENHVPYESWSRVGD